MIKRNNIIVADDDEVLRMIITEVLKYEKYKMIQCRNGKEAVEASRSDEVALVLLDWDMPIMNGYEALQIIKSNELTKNLPVIMITGMMGDVSYLENAMKAGAHDFIKKPFDPEELVARVNSTFMLFNAIRENNEIKESELCSLASHTAHAAELFINIKRKINSIQHSNISDAVTAELNEILILLGEFNSANSWDAFQQQFTKYHPWFLCNLLKKHPQLSPSEIKLAILLRQQLSTKEIASLLYQEPDSIKVARSRLRKKIGLEQDDNLVGYLAQF